MAKKKVSELDAITTLELDDLLLVSKFVDPDYESKQISVGDLSERWVDVTGDVMVAEGSDEGFALQPTEEDDFSIASTDNEGSLYLNISTADPEIIADLGADVGDVRAGRFRFSYPILVLTDADFTSDEYLLDSTNAGAYITVDSGSGEDPLSIVIRKNDGTAGMDFFLGNSFHLAHLDGTAPVAISSEANVTVLYPDGKIPQVRDQNCVIKATMIAYTLSGDGSETWIVEGDLDDAP